MFLLKKLSPLKAALTRLMDTSVQGQGTTIAKQPTKRLIVEALSEREMVRVHGAEVVPFLQGLITNDMDQLHAGHTSSMYAMFLNKAGRVMYDTIIYGTPERSTFLIECDKNISNELRRHLRLYRVRRKIEIDSADKEYQPWVLFNPDAKQDAHIDPVHETNEFLTTPDPRIRQLGFRILAQPSIPWNDLATIYTKQGDVTVTPPTSDCNYRLHRYRYGVSEGVEDLPPGKSFPLEANCDFLHGVSFHKGCYIGQELTARVHHTGVVRKRIMPLRLTTSLTAGINVVQSLAGANVGVVRGTCHNHALALLRVDPVLNTAEKNISKLVIDGDPCYAEKPHWWPRELPSKASLRQAEQ